MSETILEFIEGIEKSNNFGIEDSLQEIKEKLKPTILEEEEGGILPESGEVEKIENEKRITFHVTYSKEGKCWEVSLAGNDAAISLKRTKKMAIDTAKKLAKSFTKSQIMIHKKDGRFQIEYTYGEDPVITGG